MKPETEVLYVRIPARIKAAVLQRAQDEERTVAATAARLLEHALACQETAVKDEY